MSKATVIAISIHGDKENPIFGEGAIHMRIDDESGGGFFVITQGGEKEIRVCREELKLMAEEGEKMMLAYDLVSQS